MKPKGKSGSDRIDSHKESKTGKSMQRAPSQQVVSSRNPLGEPTQQSHAEGNPPKSTGTKISSIERVTTPGMMAGPKAVRSGATNIVQKAVLLANSSLDSLREIREMDEKKREKLLREIALLKQELREKNLRIEKLESAYTGGKDNFQRILDDKNEQIHNLTAEVTALRDLSESKVKKGEMQRLRAELMQLRKTHRYSQNLKAKQFKSKIHELQMQLDNVRRALMSTNTHTALMKKEVTMQIYQVKKKLKLKFLRMTSLLEALRRENYNLRQELIAAKATPLKEFHRRHEDSKKKDAPESKFGMEKVKPRSEKLIDLEKKLGEKKFQNEQWAAELDKMKERFDELVKDKDIAENKWADIKEELTKRLEEERKTMDDKNELLTQTVEELSKIFLNSNRINERDHSSRVRS